MASPNEIAISDNAMKVLLFILGFLLNALWQSFRNKMGVLGYVVLGNRVGTASEDAVFGSVRVMWGDTQVRNLYLLTVNLENLSAKDFDNIELHLYSNNDTFVLRDRAEFVDEPQLVQWSPTFATQMAVKQGEQPTKEQWGVFNHAREYLVPVLNRGQKLRFNFLCTRPQDDGEATMYVSTPSKGVRLKQLRTPFVVLNPIFGVPIPIALRRGIFVSVIVVVLCSLYVEQPWLASLIAMVVGLVAQVWGAALYRAEQFIKTMITR